MLAGATVAVGCATCANVGLVGAVGAAAAGVAAAPEGSREAGEAAGAEQATRATSQTRARLKPSARHGRGHGLDLSSAEARCWLGLCEEADDNRA